MLQMGPLNFDSVEETYMEHTCQETQVVELVVRLAASNCLECALHEPSNGCSRDFTT